MNAFPDNNTLAILAGICSISYLYFGFYILSPALKEKRIRPLLYLCIFSAIWSFFFLIYYHTTDAYMKNIWQRFTFTGNLAFVYLLWFILKYTGLIKNKKIEIFLSIAIWLLPLLSIYKSLSENAIARHFPFGFWFLFMEIQITIYNLISVVFMLVSYFRKKSNKSRMHALIICGSGVVFMTLSWLSDYYMGFRESENLIPLWLLFWLGILLITIKKYRFIRITPEFIGKDITENIEEGIILLDPDLKIIFKNSALLNMLDMKDSASFQLQDIVYEKEILNNEFSSLIHSDKSSFSIRINLIVSDTKKNILGDVKVKKIIDAYNDISGFLMIISKVKDLEQLKERYKISARELDVIYQIIVGSKNKEIAEMLDVTESTVKTHIASIYYKLHIKNRIELLNLLAEFNILYKAKV